MDRVLQFRSASDRWNQVFPATSYERTTPNLFALHSYDAGLRNWFLASVSEPEQKVPPQDVYICHDAFVADLGMVFDSDGNLIVPSAADQTAYTRVEALDPEAASRPPLDGPTAFIFKAGKNNYGHMLIEMLPRLELLAQAGVTRMRLLLPILPPPLEVIVRQVCADLYPGLFDIEPMTHSAMRCRELILPGPVTRHNSVKSPTVDRFVERLVDRAGRRGAAGRSLYVSRRGFANRQLLNEGDVERLFADRGYEIINPQGLEFYDQIALFSQATRLAGVLGAGLSNACFAPPGAEVTMVDNGMYDLFFYDLCCLRRQTFNWVFTRSIAHENALRLHDDWIVDLRSIEVALSML